MPALFGVSAKVDEVVEVGTVSTWDLVVALLDGLVEMTAVPQALVIKKAIVSPTNTSGFAAMDFPPVDFVKVRPTFGFV